MIGYIRGNLLGRFGDEPMAGRGKENVPIWNDIFTLKPKAKRARPYRCFPNGKGQKAFKGHRWVSGIDPANGRPCDMCARCGITYH